MTAPPEPLDAGGPGTGMAGRRSRCALRVEELTEAEIAAIAATEPPPEAVAFNHERGDDAAQADDDERPVLRS